MIILPGNRPTWYADRNLGPKVFLHGNHVRGSEICNNCRELINLGLTRALLRLERTMNLLGGEGRGGEGRGGEGRGGRGEGGRGGMNVTHILMGHNI